MVAKQTMRTDNVVWQRRWIISSFGAKQSMAIVWYIWVFVLVDSFRRMAYEYRRRCNKFENRSSMHSAQPNRCRTKTNLDFELWQFFLFSFSHRRSAALLLIAPHEWYTEARFWSNLTSVCSISHNTAAAATECLIILLISRIERVFGTRFCWCWKHEIRITSAYILLFGKTWNLFK